MPSLTNTLFGRATSDPYQDRTSLEFSFRAKRFTAVRKLIENALAERGRCDIVDLGGTEKYWLVGEEFIRANRSRLRLTIVNTEPQTIDQPDLFSFVHASATDTALFADRRFDLVHSNSVIEHVGFWPEMERFAANVRRLADRYYIQTPNYWFPYEPHFRFPGFQYLPEPVRIWLITHYQLGFFPKIESRDEAQQIIDEHRLLSTRRVRKLFPDAVISHEKFFHTNKSIVAIRDLRS